jgi:hypothetical protein
MEVPSRVAFRWNNVRRIFNSGDSPFYLKQILTGGQRGNAGVTGALDLDLLAQAIRDNE